MAKHTPPTPQPKDAALPGEVERDNDANRSSNPARGDSDSTAQSTARTVEKHPKPDSQK